MAKFKLFTDYIFRFVQRLFFVRDKRRQPKPNLTIERTFVPLKRRSKVLSEVWYVILGYSDMIKSTALHRTGLEMIQEDEDGRRVSRVDATGNGPPSHHEPRQSPNIARQRQTQLTSFPHRKYYFLNGGPTWYELWLMVVYFDI